tara:strand:- start:61 stop:810 length:750 start_codon:yes stop_codon:yes gene_type:complete
MEDFGVFRGRHEIEFATDEKDRITVIVGGSGKGKTTIFNAIKNGLGFRGIEKLEDPSNAKSNVEIEGDKITNEEEIELCLFLDGEYRIDEKMKRFTKENVDDSFIDEMNELFTKSGSFQQHLHFARNENSISYFQENDLVYHPSAYHSVLKNIIFWTVLRKRVAPKSFLIADSLFHNMNNNSQRGVFEILKETGLQIVLLATDTEYRSHTTNDLNDPQMSLKEFITGQMNVREYNLISTEEGTKIELIY